MNADEVRGRIRAQHDELRSQLGHMTDLIAMAGADEAGAVRMLTRLARLLMRTLRAHLDMEDALLVPAIAESDPAGSARARSLLEHHREQRLSLAAVIDSCTRPGVRLDELGRRLRDLFDELHADMELEEASYLTHEVLRDDVVGIDVETG